MDVILYLIGIILIILGAFRIMSHRVDLGWIGTAIVFFTAFILPHLT